MNTKREIEMNESITQSKEKHKEKVKSTEILGCPLSVSKMFLAARSR
jgi:hypothetical protein